MPHYDEDSIDYQEKLDRWAKREDYEADLLIPAATTRAAASAAAPPPTSLPINGASQEPTSEAPPASTKGTP